MKEYSSVQNSSLTSEIAKLKEERKQQTENLISTIKSEIEQCKELEETNEEYYRGANNAYVFLINLIKLGGQ